MDSDTYFLGRKICTVILFIGAWIYCVATYGFLIGVGLGWLPSIIFAVIAGYLWPLWLICIVGLVLLLLYSN